MAAERKQKFVVVVDDDELIRDALRGLLKEAGFSALAFASAEDFRTPANWSVPHA